MKKYIIITISTLFLLFSCGKNNQYRIEGELANLSDPTLYVVYEMPEGNMFDTIQADNKGRFRVTHELIENLQTITVFYHDKEKRFMIYPEENKPVQIKGDAQYPKLIQIKGGRINNKLNEYRKKVASLLKEQTDKENEETPNGGNAYHLANIDLELHRITQDFIERNPKEKASAILISEYFNDPENTLHTEELLNILSPASNDFYIVKDLRNQIDKAKESIVGVKAPQFNVTNIYGQVFTQDSFLNKYYVLAFTAFWCDLCQTEIMMLDHLTSEYAKDSLEIMMVSLDDDSKEVIELLKKDSIKWNLVIDSAGQAIDMFDKYNVNSLPRCFLMDKEGIIKLRTSNGAELKQVIDELLK